MSFSRGSPMLISPLFHFRWPSIVLLLLLLCPTFSRTWASLNSYKVQPLIPYMDHCGSIVPESTPTGPENGNFPVLRRTISYYSGGDPIFSKRSSSSRFYVGLDSSFQFNLRNNVFKTNTKGIYKLEASLAFQVLYEQQVAMGGSDDKLYYRNITRQGSVVFWLGGFWSQFSGKLCMVGSASWRSKENNFISLDAVLKLNYPSRNSTIFTSLASGTLESISPPDHEPKFQPIKIFSLPELTNYSYSLVSKDLGGLPDEIDVPANQSLGLHNFCHDLRIGVQVLEYAGQCKSTQNCTRTVPEGIAGNLPGFVDLNQIQCSPSEQKVRFIIRYLNSSREYYYQSFDPRTTLIGEGSWDSSKNRLYVVACRILTASNSLERSVGIGDCSIRLALRYPAIWNITSRSSIVGLIWSNKTANDSGYFEGIKFRNYRTYRTGILPGVKYDYTELATVREWCPQNAVKGKGMVYPSTHSPALAFHMSVWISSTRRNFASGSASPIFVGPELYNRSTNFDYTRGSDAPSKADLGKLTNERRMNISYRISLNPSHGGGFPDELASLALSSSSRGQILISAEGVYDTETGSLCMVGCRKINSSYGNTTSDLLDCKMFVNVSFMNTERWASITGTISSTRNQSDPLFFEQLQMHSIIYFAPAAKQVIWRMDLEIIMVLISNTLACVFVAVQLFHVKRHPYMLPFISQLMLAILTVGHMIPLVLNFEALFIKDHIRQDVPVGTDKLLDANEVVVRMVTMVAFLLEVRLLQLAWSARWQEEYGKGFWASERKTLLVSLPLYCFGGLIALIVNHNRKQYGHTFFGPQIALGALKSYSGLVIDSFLLPQILLNIFHGSKESALCHPFYIGTTLVRLLPHAYDLYRDHRYVNLNLKGLVIYANSSSDYYTTAWDLIIPCGGIFLAVVIWLQQRFGGRYIIPNRFRNSKKYIQLSSVSS